MCEGQSNLKKTMRLKDEPFQNATEAAKANWIQIFNQEFLLQYLLVQ